MPRSPCPPRVAAASEPQPPTRASALLAATKPAPDSALPGIVTTPLAVPAPVARPKAQVRALPADPLGDGIPERPVGSQEPIAPQPARAEDLDMVAPVEMWFGEYRVGVKAGTKTYAAVPQVR